MNGTKIETAKAYSEGTQENNKNTNGVHSTEQNKISEKHSNGVTEEIKVIKTKVPLTIRPGHMTLSDLRKVYQNPIHIRLHHSAYDAIKKSSDCVDRILKKNKPTYGINTGIGLLATKSISSEDLETLQRAIVTSHAAGVGPNAEEVLVRLIMVLKINSLARGFSGIRREVIDGLIALVNAEIYPCIPVKGSVGASGDLAPLSHMSIILLGQGKATCKGEVISATEALERIGLKPFTLVPKEGVALVNGGQVSAAFALKGLFLAEDLFAAGVVIGSLTVDAAMGSRKAFDERIQEVRGQRGQIDVAAAYRQLLGESSSISESHKNCSRVQDPYSLRSQPQVMGACLSQLRYAAEILKVEANAVSDNPLIFSDQNEAISGANFHAEPTAMAADNLALALAEIGSMSERRTALLMDKHMTQLPGFLTNNSGLYSGFMTAHVTAAALVSENKCLSHPASVDSIPTSGNQEDHVSMAPYAGRRLWEMAANLRNILAVEWLAACQALDMRQGLRTSDLLEKAKGLLRSEVGFYVDDRYFAPDIAVAYELLALRCLTSFVPESLLPSLH